jgi:hypothetical protein
MKMNMKMNMKGALSLLLLFLLVFLPVSTRADVIDRILAVVDDQIITLSDARAVLRFELLPADVSEDPVAAVMQRLIDRRLMLNEVERYETSGVPAAAIDARVAAIQSRFEDALGLEIALNQTAWAREDLRRFIHDTRRIEAYLQQRFATALLDPSAEDIQRYYKEHPEEFTVKGVLRPFADMADQIRDRLSEQRREPVIRDWIEGLRRRANIVIVYLPGRG